MSINYDFILTEYKEMFSEKRYYDGRFSSLIALYISLITFTISETVIVQGVANISMNIINAVVALMCFLAGILIFLSLYFNRVNYVKVCRQINAIRQFCLKNNIPEFAEFNHMYVDDKFPKYFMKKSIHFIFFYFIAILNGIFSFFSLFLFFYEQALLLAIILGILVGIIIVFMEIFLVSYLSLLRDRKETNINVF